VAGLGDAYLDGELVILTTLIVILLHCLSQRLDTNRDTDNLECLQNGPCCQELCVAEKPLGCACDVGKYSKPRARHLRDQDLGISDE